MKVKPIEHVISATFLLIAALIFLGACRTPTALVAVLPLEYPDFQTYSTPRTFDGPGTVFRVDKARKKHATASLSVVVTNIGQESFPIVSRARTWDISLLAKFLGKADISGSGGFKSQLVLDATLGSGSRFRTYDQDVDNALRSAGIQYKENNRYYVVRETVAFKKVDFELSRSNLVSADAKATFKIVADLKGEAARLNATETKLSQEWNDFHHVFFIVDEILPPGKGLLGDQPRRLPLTVPISLID